jgi:hypothetical protein
VLAPCSVGDLADRLTILELKLTRIPDSDKRHHIEREYAQLLAVWGDPFPDEVRRAMKELGDVNMKLWDLEELARKPEGFHRPDGAAILKQITEANDRRAAIKREINLMTGSEIIEEKSHVR